MSFNFGILDQRDFFNLTDYEKKVFKSCLDNNIPKISKNWGVIIFKPPRASSYLAEDLYESLCYILKCRNIRILSRYKVELLTEKHVSAMYPWDHNMPYWSDLEKKLLGKQALYFLIESDIQEDITNKVRIIKGWYKPDKSRNRFSETEGLRAVFRYLVEKKEGMFNLYPTGSDQYEDSGIHAPCSARSRFLQLLGFMSIDEYGAKWARLNLEWLKNSSSGGI